MNNDYGKEYFKEREFTDKTYYMAQQWISALRPDNCFDFGCGEGFMVHAVNYLGVDCNGFDISKYAVKTAYGLSKGKISNKKPRGKYDLVLCLDVMEHLNPEDEQGIIDGMTKLSSRYLLLSICDTMLSKVYVDPTHINVKPRAYWEHQFTSRGFEKLDVPKEWLFSNQLYLYRRTNGI